MNRLRCCLNGPAASRAFIRLGRAVSPVLLAPVDREGGLADDAASGVVARRDTVHGEGLYHGITYHGTYCMFERFSRGYYLGRLYVEPSADGSPAMCREQHEQVNRQLYTDGEGIERTDRPLVVKLGTRHLAVEGDEAVPADTLAVPEDVLAEVDVANPPTLQEVLLAKADRARQLLSMTGTAL